GRLQLTISTRELGETVVTACKQFTWSRDGQTYTISGNHDYVFQNVGGCTDTVRLHLTINQSTFSKTAITICQNQVPYTWNTVSYTTSGTYTFVTKNSVGCDSTATLVLNIVQTIKGPVDSTTVCANTLPYQWNGITITAAGTYIKTLQSAAGCDSIATVVVATQPLATATISGGNPICVGQSTTISIALTGAAPWTLSYTEGSTSHDITGITSSPYVLTVTPGSTTTYTLKSVSDLKCTNTALNSAVTVAVTQGTQKGVRYPTVTA